MLDDMNAPTVDIVTISFADAERFPTFLAALREFDYPADRIRLVVVDNDSSDGALPYLRSNLGELPFAAELIEAGQNLGFSGGCNRGAAAGTSDYILFLNADTFAHRDMVRRLVERAEREPKAGLLEAHQYPHELRKLVDSATGRTDWCSGAALLARRSAFEAVKGFDEIFYPAYCEDVDLSWRMWLAGWMCVFEPGAVVRHDTMEPGAVEKPLEKLLTTQFSFVMHFIYDSSRGFLIHLIRGFRYLISHRTDSVRRRGVAKGLSLLIRKMPELIARRRAARSAIAGSNETERF
ncbi:MAG TPA: glycosyltransferase family 2 protein, partial [Pyrinomonadaceae bacterium]|nr:glycosyltransferase family 2 protein [Pyrinomonadaceae bacterium]